MRVVHKKMARSDFSDRAKFYNVVTRLVQRLHKLRHIRGVPHVFRESFRRFWRDVAVLDVSQDNARDEKRDRVRKVLNNAKGEVHMRIDRITDRAVFPVAISLIVGTEKPLGDLLQNLKIGFWHFGGRERYGPSTWLDPSSGT